MLKQNRLFIFLLMIFTFSALNAKELRKVTLQLSWFDQFQFAGYYIAKEKGFYKNLGLDVEIKPFKFGINIPELVNNSKIDFAIGRETLILEKAKNENIVALYAMFQATPLVLLSTKESDINTIEKFKNKRVMTTIEDSGEVSLKAMLISHKLDLNELTFLKHSHNYNDLINNKTDLISAYISKTPFWLQQRNIEYNIFDPKKYGFDLYSDFLYTNKKLIDQNIQLVKSFKEASIKGWEYAYANIEEASDLIIKKYNNQNLSKDELVFEAVELRKLSFFNSKKLGQIKKEKVQRIHDLYNVLGLIDKKIDIDSFMIESYLKDNQSLELSNSHKNYIEKNPIVNMCIIPDIRPYSFIENNNISGFAIDYFNLLEEKTGLSFNLIKTENLSQSLEYLKNKKCDILSSAVKLKERESFANFTKSFIDVPFVLVTNAKASFIDDISVLRNKKISLVKNYASTQFLQKIYKNIDFVLVDSMDEGLKKVENDELYGHIDLLYTSWYKIHANNLNKLRVSAKLDYSVPISIAVRKDYHELYEILDIAVSNIDSSIVDQILQRWVSVEYKKEIDYSIIWQILFVVFVIFLAIMYKQKVLKDVNENLKIKVDEKNKELILINEQLEKRVKIEVEENLKKDRLLSQQSKMVSMGRMIENIAHQWRQPLSLITTLASSIKIKQEINTLDEVYLKESIENIVRTSNHLSETIDDFRYFFEPEKQQKEFLLNDCCLKVVNLLNSTFQSKNIKIKISATQDIKIKSFERELIQVLINIFNNSKDAFDENMSLKIILLELIKENDKAIIKVKDNANGIDEDIIENIYEPYFTTKHRSQGTGIGLYMCREIIIKHMNGMINTENIEFSYNDEKYKGALTTITLDAI